MANYAYKEITILPEESECWNDVIINAGAPQSTLQDIKLPETAGCFSYRRINNRFIYWRTTNDVLELVEVSFDVSLIGNHLRLRFQHAPILQGVSIHETSDCIVILVPTVSAIHRFNFPYPKLKVSQDYFSQSSDISHPSIFFNASSSALADRSSYFTLNHASSGVPLPHTSCSWLTSDGNSAFVLANNAESHLMVVMEPRTDKKPLQLELKRTSVMSRLWNGLVRGSQGGDVSLGLVCHQEESDVFIFSLCRDLRIRMWSQNKQECLVTLSTLDHFGESSAAIIANSTAQHCWLRKSVNPLQEFFLGVYLSLPQFNQFLIFQPMYVNEQYRLAHVVTLMNSRDDLVDFCVNSYQVWGLWLNSDNMPVVKVASIQSNDATRSSIDWMPVNLEPCVSNNIYIALGSLDYTEVYLREIFKPGRFSTSTIAKVLYIYNKTIDAHSSISSNPQIEVLRNEVTKAVSNEVFSMEKDAELSDEDLLQLKVECWDKFFSYCIQYHEVGTKPLGLTFDPFTGYGMIIKKNVYSILCPCDPFEQLRMIDPLEISDVHRIFLYNPVISEDYSIKASIAGILRCMSILTSFINDDMINGFEHELFNLQAPDAVGLEIVKELARLPSDPEGSFLMTLQSQLQVIPDLITAVRHLLRELDVAQKVEPHDLSGNFSPGFGDYQNFLHSSAGLNFLCEGFNQFVKQRFYFCRDLLLLELLICQLGEMSQISFEIVNSINSELLPFTRMLINCYYVLKWMSECEFITKLSTHLEAGIKQLSLLEISESSQLSKHKSDTSCRTIIYYYLDDQGRRNAYMILSNQVSFDDFRQIPWMQFLPQLVANIASLLWPMGPYFHFPEFLLNNGQCVPLQNYIRLLKNWCDWNAYSRHFLDANCFLIFGEYDKAVRLFVTAADGIHKEDFLRAKILSEASRSMETVASPVAQYYMKVIQLFEQYKLSTFVIELATTAISILDKDDSYLPIFWSVIFKHHLELGHSQEAYTALTHNPDLSRKKDCLRQMIVEMCTRKEFHILVKFPYLDMQEEVVAILEMKARSSDLLHQSFYDLLYAFHMETSNFRKAATIMYECAMRLSQEANNYEGLQKQASCLLSTINCLYLVDPKYAWIVKPIPTTVMADLDNENIGMSPKRDFNGENVPNLGVPKKRIEVLEISDIRREFDLIRARLLLVQQDQSVSNLATCPLSPSECVTLLVKAGFFDTAIELSYPFSLPLNPIFEGLTHRCILTMLHPFNPWLKDEDKEIFDWLGQNDSSNLPAMGHVNAKEQAWYLLKYYLVQYEKEGQTQFHRCIASKLLSLGIHLPIWLKHSYQKRNSSELLWLYIKYVMLEEATKLAIDMIDAALGNVKEDFGIKYQVRATNPPVWLPHSYFDALCEALEDIECQVNCTELYKELTKKLDEYVTAVEKVSGEIVIMNRGC